MPLPGMVPTDTDDIRTPFVILWGACNYTMYVISFPGFRAGAERQVQEDHPCPSLVLSHSGSVSAPRSLLPFSSCDVTGSAPTLTHPQTWNALLDKLSPYLSLLITSVCPCLFPSLVYCNFTLSLHTSRAPFSHSLPAVMTCLFHQRHVVPLNSQTLGSVHSC